MNVSLKSHSLCSPVGWRDDYASAPPHMDGPGWKKQTAGPHISPKPQHGALRQLVHGRYTLASAEPKPAQERTTGICIRKDCHGRCCICSRSRMKTSWLRNYFAILEAVWATTQVLAQPIHRAMTYEIRKKLKRSIVTKRILRKCQI